MVVGATRKVLVGIRMGEHDTQRTRCLVAVTRRLGEGDSISILMVEGVLLWTLFDCWPSKAPPVHVPGGGLFPPVKELLGQMSSD